MSPQTPILELPSGSRLNNRYRVITRLGEGGMGRVFLVADELQEGRQVALKTMRSDLGEDEFFGFFSHEFQALTKLKHPNLAEVHDFGRLEETGECFFTLEYVIGRNLFDATRGAGLEGILEHVVQVCRALEYIHSRGLIHHDVKPENVLVVAQPDGGVLVKLMDFGLALEEHLAAGRQDAVRGTFHYLAPEIAAGDPYDRRADLYSLGILLYRLLRGRLPAEEMPTDRHQYFSFVPRPPDTEAVDLDPRARALLRRLVAANPASRFANANEVVLEINRLFGTQHEIETKETTTGYVLSGKFVGRAAEREGLDRLTTELQLGAPSRPFLLVAGEEGIGKRRLVREWRVSCQLAGLAFVQARCYEDLRSPYGPLADVLRQVVSLVGPESPLVHRYRVDLSRLLAELAPAGGGEAAPARPAGPQERLRLMDSLTHFLLDAAGIRPLVVAVTDLHWADSETVELVKYLVRTLYLSYAAPETGGQGVPRILDLWERRTRPALVLAGTYCDDAVAGKPLEAAIAELAEDRYLELWTLPRLGVEEVASLVGSMLGLERAPLELARRLAEETDGNPFFVEEVMKSLVEDNQVTKTGGAWNVDLAAGLEIPASCETVVQRRLGRLDEGARRLAEALAVIARPAAPGLLRELAASGFEPMVGLRELERLHLVAREREGEAVRYQLTQNSSRRMVYRGMPAERRRELHRQVAAALERAHAGRTDAVIVELAHHHLRGGERAPAIRYGVQAAKKSAELFAHAQAISLYEDVLALVEPDDGRTRGQVLAELGDLHKLAANYDVARRYYQEAVRLAQDKLEEAGLLRRMGEMAVRQGDHPEGLRVYDQVAAILADLPGAGELRAELLVGYGRLHELAGQYDLGLEKARAALALGPSERVAGVAYQLLGNLSWCLGRYQEAILHHEKGLAIESARGSAFGLAVCYNNLGLVYQDLGQSERATDFYQKSLEQWEKYGDPSGRALCYSNLGILHQSQGEYARSVQYHREALNIYERLGDRMGVARASECLGEVYSDLGRWTESEACHQRCLEICEKTGNVPLSIYAYLNLGQNYATFGALRQALEHAERAIERATKIQARMLIGAGFLLQGDVCRRRQDWEGALSFLERAHDLFAELGNRPEKARASWCLARLFHEMGEEDAAEKRARTALEEARALSLRELEAELSCLTGVIHHGRGQLEEARAELDAALRLARALDKHELLWKIAHESGRLRYSQAEYAKARDEYMQAVELGKRIWEALPADLKELFLKDPRHPQLSRDITVLKNRLMGRLDG